MPVSTIQNLSNYTVGGPSFTGTFSLEGMPQGGPLCNKMGALINDGIFSQWVKEETGIEDLSLHEYTLVVQDNLLNLHVKGDIHTFKGANQPLNETTTTAMLRSGLTELLTEPAQMQNNHLIPIIETAQNIFGGGARRVGYNQSTKADNDAYNFMAQMHKDSQITHRETVAAFECIILSMIENNSTRELPQPILDSLANFTPPKDLTDEVVNLKVELEQTKKDLEEVRAENADLQEAKESLTGDIETLTQRLTEAEQKLKESQDRVEELEKQLADAISERDKAKGELKSATGQVSRLESELAQARKRLQKTEQELTTVQATNGTLFGKNQELSQQVRTLSTEAEKARHEREKALQSCTKLQERLKAAELELEHAAAEATERALHEAPPAPQTQPSPKKEDKSLANRARKALGKASQAAKEKEAIASQLEESKRTLTEANRRVSALEEQIQTMGRELESHKSERDQAHQSLASAEQNFLREKEDLTRRYESLAREFKFLEETHRQTLLKNQDLGSRLEGFSQAKTRIHELENELKAQQTVLSGSAEKNRQLIDELDEATRSNQRLLTEIEGLEESHKKGILDLAKTHSIEVDMLKDDLLNKEGQIRFIEDEHKEKIKQIESQLSSVRKQHSAQIIELEATLEEQEQLLESARENYEAKIQTLEKDLEREQLMHRENIQKAHDKVQEVLGEYQETIARQSSDIEILENQLTDMNSSFQAANREAEQKFAQYEATIQSNQNKINMLSEMNEDLAEWVLEQADLVAADKIRIQTLEAEAKQDISMHQDELLDSFGEGFNKGYDAGTESTAAISSELAEVTARVSHLQEQHSEAKNTVKRLRSQLQLAEEKANLFGQSVKSKEAQLKRLEESHNEEINSLTVLVDECNQSLRELRATLEQTQEQREESQKKLEESHEDLLKLQTQLQKLSDANATLKELTGDGMYDAKDIDSLTAKIKELDRIQIEQAELKQENASLKSEIVTGEELLKKAQADKNQAVKRQGNLEEKLELLQAGAADEARSTMRANLAEERAEKAENDLRALMKAITAAKKEGNIQTIQDIFDQYQYTKKCNVPA